MKAYVQKISMSGSNDHLISILKNKFTFVFGDKDHFNVAVVNNDDELEIYSDTRDISGITSANLGYQFGRYLQGVSINTSILSYCCQDNGQEETKVKRWKMFINTDLKWKYDGEFNLHRYYDNVVNEFREILKKECNTFIYFIDEDKTYMEIVEIPIDGKFNENTVKYLTQLGMMIGCYDEFGDLRLYYKTDEDTEDKAEQKEEPKDTKKKSTLTRVLDTLQKYPYLIKYCIFARMYNYSNGEILKLKLDGDNPAGVQNKYEDRMRYFIQDLVKFYNVYMGDQRFLLSRDLNEAHFKNIFLKDDEDEDVLTIYGEDHTVMIHTKALSDCNDYIKFEEEDAKERWHVYICSMPV